MADPAPFATHTTREMRDAHKGQVRTLGWNCNGRKLATGSVDETVKTWSVDMYNPGRERRDSELQIGREPHTLCWSPTHPDQLATSASDNLIRVWDVRTSKAAATVKLKKSDWLFLAWNPSNPDILAAVHKDSDVSFIDWKKQKVLQTLATSGIVYEVRFSRDGGLFFLTVAKGGVEVYTYPALKRLHSLMGHLAAVRALDFDPNERLMASGGVDATVSVFELATLTCVRSITDLQQPVRCVSLSADGAHVAFATEEQKQKDADGSASYGGVYVICVESGERAAFLKTQQEVNELRWNPRHPVLAYTGGYYGHTRSMAARYGAFCIWAPKKA